MSIHLCTEVIGSALVCVSGGTVYLIFDIHLYLTHCSYACVHVVKYAILLPSCSCRCSGCFYMVVTKCRTLVFPTAKKILLYSNTKLPTRDLCAKGVARGTGLYARCRSCTSLVCDHVFLYYSMHFVQSTGAFQCY